MGQPTMGLLDHITAHSMDADYAYVSRRPDRAEDPRSSRPGTAAMVVVGLFGLLVATAGVQTARTAVASEGGHEELVTQIEARDASVQARRDRIADLRAENKALEQRSLRTTVRGRAMSARLSRLAVQAGSVPVHGPGVRVVVDDAPDATGPEQQVLDQDLQKLVNALWLSGAEAIAINGQRLTSLSAIRHAGSAITVNYRSLLRPYVVTAIGNPDTIPARFVETRHGAEWLNLEARFGLQFEMTTESSLRVPAANHLTLRHATTPRADR